MSRGCSKCSISHMCDHFKDVEILRDRIADLEKKVEALSKSDYNSCVVENTSKQSNTSNEDFVWDGDNYTYNYGSSFGDFEG